MPGPHDALFHQVFSVPEDAAGYLSAVLPRAVADGLDWSTLERYPATFKGVGVRAAHVDLVHRLVASGAERHVYLLLEHKSSADPRLALQLHRYVHRLIDQVGRDEPESEGLALVVPVVVYHGDRRWDGRPGLRELFRCPPALAPGLLPYLPELEFVFEDLTSTSDARLARAGATAHARLALDALRRGRTDEEPHVFFRRVRDLVHEVARARDGDRKLASIYAYIAQVRGLPRERMVAIIRQELGPEQEERMQSTYDQIYQEGRQEGRQQGRQEGRAVGLGEGLLDAVRVVLTTRFGGIPEHVLERLRSAGPEQLRECVARAARVSRCEDVLVEREPG